MDTGHLAILEKRIEAAVQIAQQFGMIDGGHHKMWVIDQMIRFLLGDEYNDWLVETNDPEYDPWDEGIPP